MNNNSLKNYIHLNKTALKIFLLFITISTITTIILLVINFIGVAYIGSDEVNGSDNAPQAILNNISESLIHTGGTFTLTDETILPADHWCILINEAGYVVWSQNLPADVPTHYTLNDIAAMTRWFINDYPVYVKTEDYGLLVLGQPKNAVGKYPVEYSMDWFDNLPQRLLVIIFINICLATVLACLFGAGFYKRLQSLVGGVQDLQREKTVRLRESGIFKELSRNINATSATIERKNTALICRDHARSNWINGVSHDIKTPLTLINGYAESLTNSPDISPENRRKAEIITAQSIRITNLINDLNLISSLEYDMQPSQKQTLRICPLLRQTVSEIINSGLDETHTIIPNLQCEKTQIAGDERLLSRAFYNLLNNSIRHNPEGCDITITAKTYKLDVVITIADNGKGVPEKVLANMYEIPKTAHGLGLPMAYKIINAHGGAMTAENHGGLVITITLPQEI